MTEKINSADSLYTVIRFIASLLVLLALAWIDLKHEESINNVVYLLIGGLNGVDAVKLYREISKP